MYRHLGDCSVTEGVYRIVPIRREDMEFIRLWRNAQMNILRQKQSLTPEDQERYYDGVVAQDFDAQRPRKILVSYLREGVCIGYGGLVHINWPARRAEVSFLLDTQLTQDKMTHCTLWKQFLSLLVELAFGRLHLNKLTTEVYDLRPWHVDVLETFGFEREGLLRQHVQIGERWVDAHLHALFAHKMKI